MKLIILAAGFGASLLEEELPFPKCLTPLDDNTLVIDKLIENAQVAGISEIVYVGGKNIIEVMSRYPALNYFYADDSEHRGNLHSLFAALTMFQDDVIVVYGDILFKPSLFNNLLTAQGKVVYCYDSAWDHRYEGRSRVLLEEAEKVYVTSDSTVFSKKDCPEHQLLGEFVGAVLFKQEIINTINSTVNEIVQQSSQATVLDLLNHSKVNSWLSPVDLKGEWAELDSSQDINNFQFGTKADTLENLRSKLHKSTVLEQYSFTVQEWLENEADIVFLLQKKFCGDSSIVVRSSAINEDTANASMAGNFDSVLDVDITSRIAIKDAIDCVATSYREKEKTLCVGNQIFVQPFLSNTDISGVAFTRDLETKAPYYVVNFDETSKKTDTVTSGTGSNLKTFIVNKFDRSTDTPWLNTLLDALEEIEEVTHDDFLDIEFAIKGSCVMLLQVRPIAAHKNELRVADVDFIKATASIREYIKNKTNSNQLGSAGQRTAYGIMPDWNPAEIIGISPKPLALSLYKELITDHVWPRSRAYIGYRGVGHNVGMISLGGRPYIDLRTSFNTFTPQALSDDIAARLADFYISYLEGNRHLHDKVEFEVALTTYSFNIEQQNKHLQKGGFSSQERNEIIEAFRLMTQDILENPKYDIDQIMADLQILKQKQLETSHSQLSCIEKIYNLNRDCEEYGTFQFSILARFAFIANILLKSLVSIGVVQESRFHDFFETISTIPKMLISDLTVLEVDELENKYGHLRPGTYDIESESYRESSHALQNTSKQNDEREVKDFTWTSQEIEGIECCLKQAGFYISFEKFMMFIKKSIEAREFAKFIFTRSISKVLDNCVALGNSLNITRREISFLNINDISRYYGGNVSFNMRGELLDKIRYNEKQFLLTHSIKLPPLIFSDKDVDCHLYESEEPNFITNLKCSATVQELTGKETSVQNLSGKIVLIEKADPGFDWLFSHDIKGLVTQYGGVASHMAIRCAELGLPAAIGCGALVYQFVVQSHSIELDCSSRQIRRVS